MIPFYKLSINNDEIEAVVEVLKNGWLTSGEKAVEFENNFARYVGADYAISLNSCTAALHCALKAVGVGYGDEVIVPAMTFVATAQAVEYCGAIPVIVDVDYNTHCISIDNIKKAINNKTKAIIPVHYSGQPCDIENIIEIAHKHKLFVIEDAAHALPSYYNGKLIGTFGDATCFSFYANKTITTGEGGMVTTNNIEIAEKIRKLRLHGVDKDILKRKNGLSWSYDIVCLGYKYNMSDINAAIGIVQLRKADIMHTKRTKIAEMYNKSFDQSVYITPYTVDKHKISSWHLYPLKLNTNFKDFSIEWRDKLILLLRQRKIAVSVHYTPLYRFSYYRKNIAEFPMSEAIYESTISLPIYPELPEDEVNYIIENIMEICQKIGKSC